MSNALALCEKRLSRNWRVLTLGLVLFAITAPIFRSGGRTGLTFWGWVINHTIWGDVVEYVPEEDYLAEFGVGE